MSTAPVPDRPVFIVAPHRSGTTVLYRILGRHPDTAYLSELGERWPRLPWLPATAARLGLDDLPREGQRVWDRWRPRDDDLRDASHALPEAVAFYRKLVTGTLRHRGRTRFVAKYPRLSLRIPWLEALFPGALYVHLMRDWRAVVSSTVERHVKREGREQSWFGVYPPDWRDWVGRDAAEISTHQFVAAQRAILAAAPALGTRYVPVHYEALCAQPQETMHDLATRLDLAWDDRFARVVRSFGLESRNSKWRQTLGAARVATLRESDPDFLARFEDASEGGAAG